MDFFPVFLNLQQQPCLVIGGGQTAARKIDLLLQASAQVTVIAPSLCGAVQRLADAGNLNHLKKPFEDRDLQHIYRLVIAATNDTATNRQVSRLAQLQGLAVNVVDQPELCNFIMPAIVDRSPIQIAISTGGRAPVLARLLRAKLETVIPAAYGHLAQFADMFRDKVKQWIPFNQRRKVWETALQGSIAEQVLAGDMASAAVAMEKLLQQTQNNTETVQGEVYVVGAGPGDPDLLTFRAMRLMQQADIVLYDRLVSPLILNLVRRDAERINVGKAPKNHPVPQQDINQLLIEHARQGKKVLRLKGGDPFIFGRGGEELQTLIAHGIPFQVVPGITAALGAAAYSGIPLTHRDYAQSCLFVTGHLKNDAIDLDWPTLARTQQTTVIYMGLRGLPVLCHELIAHGLPADYPIALIENATCTDQRVITGTLATLPGLAADADIRQPSLTIIGEVVKLHKILNPLSLTSDITTDTA